jgi:hypothetical protein
MANVPLRMFHVPLRTVDERVTPAHQLRRTVGKAAMVISERLPWKREIHAT